MGSTIAFYCSNSDTKELSSYIESIGMQLVSPKINQEVGDNPSELPFCYVSLIPKSELSPYGKPPINVSDATDPLMGFMRAYFKEGYLVLGHLHLSNDVPDLHKQTKPKYQKISKWIKSNWRKYGDLYIGPDADLLIGSGAHLVNVFPGTAKLTIVKY